MKISTQLLFFLYLAVGITFSSAQVITIIARVPSEHIDATGQVDGANMTTVGTKFTFVRMDSGEVILADPAGGALRVDLSATDYRPPAPKVTPAPLVLGTRPLNRMPPIGKGTTPSRPPQVPVTDDTVSEVNQELGLTLFDSNNLWQENGADVGNRLGWKQDSISSYRVYDVRPALRLHMEEDTSSVASAPTAPGSPPAAPQTSVTSDLLGRSLINCLESHAYCSTLYTRNGMSDYISIIFANNGDIAAPTEEIKLTEEQVTPVIARDAKAIQKVLTKLFGAPYDSDFGPGKYDNIVAKRWDWNNTAFLLIYAPGRYVGVMLCPIAFADAHEIRSDRNGAAIMAALPRNLKKQDNGDTYIEGIPAVDQGEKGYCVPATWERYLRFLDIPGDMYFLATMGKTDFGGGTECQKIRFGLRDYLLGYQIHIDMIEPPVTLELVKKEIDDGRPIMWACLSTREIENNVYNRESLRTPATWDTYVAQLNLDKTKLAGLQKNPEDGHMRLIIGYNESTKEIDVSDSWENAKNHWLSVEEIQAEDQGDITVLD